MNIDGAAGFYVPKRGVGGRYVSGYLKLAGKLKNLPGIPKKKKEAIENLENAIKPGSVTVIGKGKMDPFVLGHEIGHADVEMSNLKHLPKSTLATLGIKAGAFYGGYKSGKADDDDKDEKRKGRLIGGSSVLAGNLQTPYDEYMASRYSLKELEKMINK